MKFLKIILISFFCLSLFSCGSDDDLSLSGDATPRVTIKFKTPSSGKLKPLDALFINVDYGTESIAKGLKQIDTHEVKATYSDFGSGNSAALFLKSLLNPALWKRNHQKQFRDI